MTDFSKLKIRAYRGGLWRILYAPFWSYRTIRFSDGRETNAWCKVSVSRLSLLLMKLGLMR